MENGVGVVEGIDEMEVKVGGNGVAESRVEERVAAGGGGGGGGGIHHGHKESEGDEFFEEAVESSLDDGNDGVDDLKPESEAAAVSASSNGDSKSTFFAAEGNDGVDGVDGSKPESDASAVSASANGDSELAFFAAEGNSSLVDEGETVENAVEGGVEVRDGEEDSSEKKEEASVEDNGEGSVVHPNDNDVVASKDVTEEAPSPVLEAEPLTIEETKAIVGNEDVIEKFVVEEKSEKADVEEAGGENAGASLVEDVKDVISNGDVNHVNEMAREPEDTSAAVSSKDETERLEELKEDLSGNEIDHGSTKDGGAPASSSSEHQENNGAASEDALRVANSEIEVSHKESEGNEMTLHPEHQDEGSRVEDTSSESSFPVDSQATASETECSTSLTPNAKKDVKAESGASDLGLKNYTADKVQSSVVTVVNNAPVAETHAVEQKRVVEEGRQNNQASRETAVNLSKTSVSSGNSANTTVPPTRPAGLGRAAPLLEPAPRAAHQPRANGQVSQAQSNLVEDTTNGEVEEGDDVREKLQMIRVKFLRLAHRLGQTPHNVVVAQVLYRLGLAEQLRARTGGRVGAFSFDRASAMAEQLEATGREPLDFSCTIMVLGKTGVGKSATINSIFNEVKFSTDAFEMGTQKVQDVVGTVEGIKVRVIDTPGLLSSCSDQRQNEKILHSVKRFIKKSPPDIVLYLDRLDMPSRDFGDTPLLRTITDIFGPSIWFNAIVVLTHAASAPPEGPNGTVTTYDMFVTQRSHAVQQAIRQAAGDMRLMNPVSLVENHSACRTNRAGQRVLPNGQVWKPHLLLLSFASKILAEANTLLRLQDSPPSTPFANRMRAPPLPVLLSSLLQSRPQLKLPEEQFGDDDGVDDDLDESSESDGESEYDELPPFKPLTKAQLTMLSKGQKKAYYDELEYREKLLMKKQLKEERRRRRMMKKMEALAKDMPGEYSENVEEESGGVASLPVPMPDLPLPASFDSDNPTHRYRCLDTSNQWLVRPALDSHGWDHDVGYEGINVERMFALRDKIPVSFSGQISKDKKDANLQVEVASSIKHGEAKATTMGFDVQSIGKDLAYTLRSETRFSNRRHNKATAGVSATVFGDVLSTGVKLENKLIVNKQFRMVMSGGAMAGRGDVAYGGSLEANFRDKDYPLGRFLSTMGVSVMDWHGELALGYNIQTQIPVGRFSNLVARANLNNRGTGQVSIRLNSSEQLQLALIGLIPVIQKLIGQRQEHAFGH